VSLWRSWTANTLGSRTGWSTNGDLRYFVNIYLNGEDVRFLDGLDTSTNSGDEISIVPAVAGG
jgi:molybdopterin converting factor small subunit